MRIDFGIAVGAALLAGIGTARADDIIVSQWGSSFAGAVYAVALDQGHFKPEGIITGVVAAQGGGASVRTIAAADNKGTLGFGVVALSAAVEAIRKGEDLRIVVTEARTIGDIYLIVPKNSPINTVQDLKGKSVGITTPFGYSDIFVALAVQQAGLPLDSVKRASLGTIAGALTAMDTGAIAATHLIDPEWQLKKNDYKLLFSGKQLPPTVQGVGVATLSLIRDYPEKLRAILLGRKRAVESIVRDPSAAARSIAKYYDRYPAEVIEQVLRGLMAPPTPHYPVDGAFDIPAFEGMLNGMRLVGGFKGEVDWSKVLDPSFLPK